MNKRMVVGQEKHQLYHEKYDSTKHLNFRLLECANSRWVSTRYKTDDQTNEFLRRANHTTYVLLQGKCLDICQKRKSRNATTRSCSAELHPCDATRHYTVTTDTKKIKIIQLRTYLNLPCRFYRSPFRYLAWSNKRTEFGGWKTNEKKITAYKIYVRIIPWGQPSCDRERARRLFHVTPSCSTSATSRTTRVGEGRKHTD